MSDKKRLEAVRGVGGLFRLPPEMLILVTDKNHPLYDPRVELPVDQGMVDSIEAFGIREPVEIRENGKGRYEIVFGRQRVKAALVVNVARRKARKEPVQVPCTLFFGDDKQAWLDICTENAVRVNDPPSMEARKIQRGLQMGCQERDLAIAFKCTPETIRNRLKLLNAHVDLIQAVDDGSVGETLARRLTDLPREEQQEALAKMRAAGATKGAKGRRAVKNATGRGGKHESGGRMRSRRFVTDWIDHLAALGNDHPGGPIGIAILNYLLGDDDALDGGRVRQLKPPSGAEKEEAA